MTTTTTPATMTDQALDKIAGHAEALKLRDVLTGWRASRSVNPVGLPDPEGELWRAARAGEALPLGLGEQFLDLERAAVAYNRTTTEVAKALAVAQERLDQAIRDGAASALGWLGGELDTLAEKVRELAGPLGGVASAETALLAGRGDAWSELLAAVETYDEIRSAQRELCISHYGGPLWVDRLQHRLLAVGLLANSLDHEGVWLAHRRAQRGRCPDRRTPAELPAYRSWLASAPAPKYPSATDRRTWWPTSDRGAYLIWLVRAPGCWVPTPDELDAAWAAATAATAAIVDAGGGATRGGLGVDQQLANVVAARARYYEVTGARRDDATTA